jgi:hypothetical protein
VAVCHQHTAEGQNRRIGVHRDPERSALIRADQLGDDRGWKCAPPHVFAPHDYDPLWRGRLWIGSDVLDRGALSLLATQASASPHL